MPAELAQQLESRHLIVLDDHSRFRSACGRLFRMCSFENVEFAADTRSAWELMRQGFPDLLLVDIHLAKNDACEGLEFVEEVRGRGNDKLIMVVSGDTSSEQFCRAANAGANDYWVKASELDLDEAVRLILRRFDNPRREGLRPTRVGEVCYFRCFRITKGDIAFLDDYLDAGLPAFEELARMGCVSHDAIKTRFSRIYKAMGLRGLAQLHRVLTACQFFRR